MKTPDLPEQLERLIDSIKRGDTEFFLAFFPADGTVNDWGTKYVGISLLNQ